MFLTNCMFPLRIMNFSLETHSSLLFKSNHILKLEDKILIENIHFINESSITFFLQSLKVGSPSALMFTNVKQSHLLLIKYLIKPSYRTDSFGKNSILIGAIINSWNKTQHRFSNLSLKTAQSK